MRKLSKARVFMLRGWTVKIENGKFYIAPSAGRPLQFRGPYKSIHHATLAIARKLSREFSTRDGKLQKAQ